MTSQQRDLDALFARRDDLEALLLRGLGTAADWDEQRRLSAAIQDALCDRMDAYLDAHRDADSPTVTIDHAAIDDWYAYQERADPFMQPED